MKLGDLFGRFVRGKTADDDPWMWRLDEAVSLAGQRNGWFTRENVVYALEGWARSLTEVNLTAWLRPYDMGKNWPKKVALIMAGNIPLVGFHDLLSVLVTGNTALVKRSSSDEVLIAFIRDYLISADPQLAARFLLVSGKMDNFDAVIATGSDNSARYFEYYFGKRPHIIRKNRNSLALLTGNETQDQLVALGEDIFRYFGLGCRNVSKLLVPENYDFDPYFNAMYAYKSMIDHHKYANNYDYNKAVYLMSEFDFLDNGFMILKEDKGLSSPIATVFYERYSSLKNARSRVHQLRDNLQCVVSNGIGSDDIAFGRTQRPGLTDYADHVDTIAFLLGS